MLNDVIMLAADCEANAGLGDVTWPGAFLGAAIVVAVAWVVVAMIRG